MVIYANDIGLHQKDTFIDDKRKIHTKEKSLKSGHVGIRQVGRNDLYPAKLEKKKIDE